MLFISSDSVSPAVPDLCGMEPQFITFGLKGYPVTADREIPVLAHVALAWLLEHSELVAERVPCLPT